MRSNYLKFPNETIIRKFLESHPSTKDMKEKQLVLLIATTFANKKFFSTGIETNVQHIIETAPQATPGLREILISALKDCAATHLPARSTHLPARL
ncbi:MAG TPA: hypothetical protein PLO43_03265 [Chlamydiales bacterium]|nr:hypothetical protein [Chlamydiales bacterium]